MSCQELTKKMKSGS
uniref:Uncharacterized protein n=1 Tax=Arundo donax TaxID=35708 RepID=A0A0A9EF14_ARUDO